MGGYKRQSDGFDGFFFGVNVPLPTFDRRKGDLEAAEAGARGALARVDLTRRLIENDVRRSLAAYASLFERIAVIRNQLLSEVDDLLRIARVSYSEGEMSLLELLDAAEAFRERGGGDSGGRDPRLRLERAAPAHRGRSRSRHLFPQRSSSGSLPSPPLPRASESSGGRYQRMARSSRSRTRWPM